MNKMKNRLSKRNSNFSPNDIKLLLALVTERKSIINSKRTDRINSQVKEDCWQAIQKAFNAKSSVFRTYRELKKKYENVKSMAKKKQLSEGNMCTYVHNSLTMPEDSLAYNQPDNNSIQNHSTSDVKVDISKVVTVHSEIEPPTVQKIANDCTRLRKIQNTTMTQKESDVTLKDFIECTSSWTKFADAKIKLNESRAEVEMQMLQEEHNIKMRHLEERHRMEMEKTIIELEILKANLDLKRRELGEHVNSYNDFYIKSSVD